jgi:hypothetical protein
MSVNTKTASFARRNAELESNQGGKPPRGDVSIAVWYCTMEAKPARRVPTFVFRADRAADVMALSQNTIGNRAPQSIFFKDSSERANSVIYGAVPSAGDFTFTLIFADASFINVTDQSFSEIHF